MPSRLTVYLGHELLPQCIHILGNADWPSSHSYVSYFTVNRQNFNFFSWAIFRPFHQNFPAQWLFIILSFNTTSLFWKNVRSPTVAAVDSFCLLLFTYRRLGILKTTSHLPSWSPDWLSSLMMDMQISQMLLCAENMQSDHGGARRNPKRGYTPPHGLLLCLSGGVPKGLQVSPILFPGHCPTKTGHSWGS